jgi:type II secretory pathway predicted ATPase ExeA
VDEPRVKRSLADDAGFQDSLSELDRGLGSCAPAGGEAPILPAPVPSPTLRHEKPEPATTHPPASPEPPISATRHNARPRLPLPPSLVSPFDALMADGGSVTPPAEPSSYRPLADLFPPVREMLDESALPAPKVEAAEPIPPPTLPLDPPAPPPQTTTASGAASADVDAADEAAPDRIEAVPDPRPVRHVEVHHERRSTPRPEPRAHASGDASSGSGADAPYGGFYGFAENPFALAPDPRFFFHSTPHDEAIQRVLTAIRQREGLVLLTGETGVGKTTLCRTVIEQLDRRTLLSFVSDPSLTGEELLKTILSDFGVVSRDELARGPAATRHELSTTLQYFVESLAPLEASAVVIIDEAQNLAADVLEQVRILGESADANRLLQVILVGQPGLVPMLRRPEYKSLHQRITVRAALTPLPAEDVGGYIAHRVTAAGGHVDFDAAAVERVYWLSHGLPRAINLLCDRALARGAEAAAPAIGAPLIAAAADDLDVEAPRSPLRLFAVRAAAIIALVLCMLIGAGVAAWMFRGTVQRTVGRWMNAPASAPRAPAARPPAERPR